MHDYLRKSQQQKGNDKSGSNQSKDKINSSGVGNQAILRQMGINQSGSPELEAIMKGRLRENSKPKFNGAKNSNITVNNTGLPDGLKAGVENLSGLAMDKVKVHYNSDKPAEMGALAYTRGTDIHVGPGQEKYLPHEAWHVVQQAKGKVHPTVQTKGKAVNDSGGLEREADIMGKSATQAETSIGAASFISELAIPSITTPAIQYVSDPEEYNQFMDYVSQARSVFGADFSFPVLLFAFRNGKKLPKRVGGHDNKRGENVQKGQKGKGKSSSDHGVNQGKQWLSWKESLGEIDKITYNKKWRALKRVGKNALTASSSASSSSSSSSSSQKFYDKKQKKVEQQKKIEKKKRKK